MVFLDSTKNAVAIKEAFHKNIPTIAVVNTTSDISQVRAGCGAPPLSWKRTICKLLYVGWLSQPTAVPVDMAARRIHMLSV
jgi:hypothetical protein